MRAAAIVSCLAAMADAVAVNPIKEKSPLVVKIDRVGNSEVKATVTNTGDVALRVLRTGSILDSSPIEKVKVSQGGM
jgi:deuterolysin